MSSNHHAFCGFGALQVAIAAPFEEPSNEYEEVGRTRKSGSQIKSTRFDPFDIMARLVVIHQQWQIFFDSQVSLGSPAAGMISVVLEVLEFV